MPRAVLDPSSAPAASWRTPKRLVYGCSRYFVEPAPAGSGLPALACQVQPSNDHSERVELQPLFRPGVSVLPGFGGRPDGPRAGGNPAELWKLDLRALKPQGTKQVWQKCSKDSDS